MYTRDLRFAQACAVSFCAALISFPSAHAQSSTGAATFKLVVVKGTGSASHTAQQYEKTADVVAGS
jgi:hypothetical protein